MRGFRGASLRRLTRSVSARSKIRSRSYGANRNWGINGYKDFCSSGPVFPHKCLPNLMLAIASEAIFPGGPIRGLPCTQPHGLSGIASRVLTLRAKFSGLRRRG
jgi:hypothetical protein